MNLKRCDNLIVADRAASLLALEEEAAGSGERGSWAKAALEWMEDRRAGKPRSVGDDFLTLADDGDPGVREMTAHALNFWEGTPEENRRIEDVLMRLSYDSGRGEETRERLDPSKDGGRNFTRKPG